MYMRAETVNFERDEAHDKPQKGTKAIVNGRLVGADSGYAEFREEVLEDRRRNMRWRCSNICVNYRMMYRPRLLRINLVRVPVR